jgi:hypothetical protein
LASRINAEHDAATASFNTGLEHALTCGRLLIEAKAKIPHGAWLPWLEKNCTVSTRMSQIYMRVAKETPQLGSNAKRVADFSLRQAIAAVSRQVATAAKLPAPVVTKALGEGDDPAIQGALKRAENKQKLQKAQAETAQRYKDNQPVTEFIQMPMRAANADEAARGEALADLLSRLRKVLRDWLVLNPAVPADMIFDTINTVYCEVEDGTLIKGANTPVDAP